MIAGRRRSYKLRGNVRAATADNRYEHRTEPRHHQARLGGAPTDPLWTDLLRSCRLIPGAGAQLAGIERSILMTATKESAA